MPSIEDEIAPYIVSSSGQLILHVTAILADNLKAEKTYDLCLKG
jgi:hypothetical protein